MNSSVENICRTCMLNENKDPETINKNRVKMKITQMVPIFRTQNEAKEKFKLLELIKATIPQLKIDENDQLPKKICIECFQKIKEMYNFQVNCVNSEKKLYKMIEEQEGDTLNDFKDPEDNEALKTEFEDSFIEENSMKSDDEFIMEEEINRAAEATEEFIESCSDLSIDLVWDDDNTDSEWDPKNIAR